MLNDWEIRSRAHTCARTNHEFTEGEFFYTLLFRDGEGFRREDVSEEAWNNRNDNIEPFSFWRSKYEPPPPAAPEPMAKGDAETLLRQLIAEQDPAKANVCYILALMLERKRILKPMDSNDDDIIVYERVVTGETFVLRNPNLSLDQIPAIQMEVGEMLTGS